MNLWIAGLMFPALFLLIFQGMPVAFALILPAFLAGWYAFGPMVFDQMYGALYGAATNHILSAIPMFVLMGALLERSGIAARLFRTMQLWLGGLPGGLAIATIAMAASQRAFDNPQSKSELTVLNGKAQQRRAQVDVRGRPPRPQRVGEQKDQGDGKADGEAARKSQLDAARAEIEVEINRPSLAVVPTSNGDVDVDGDSDSDGPDDPEKPRKNRTCKSRGPTHHGGRERRESANHEKNREIASHGDAVETFSLLASHVCRFVDAWEAEQAPPFIHDFLPADPSLRD